ncbi:MAG: hypothetical protein ACFFDN_19940 [Candidatus Hodarchaeota archaeon]
MKFNKAMLFALIVYISFFIGILIFYFILGQLLTGTELIFLIYNQTSLGGNLGEPFIYGLFIPFLSFPISIGLSYALLALIRIFYRRKNRIFQYFEFEDYSNFFLKSWKISIHASLFTFNISFQIMKIPDILSGVIYDPGGRVMPMIYGYFALLPIFFILTSSVYGAIWALSNSNLFVSIEIKGILIQKKNAAKFFEDLFWNYSLISTIITLITITFDYYYDIVTIGYELPFHYIIVFPAFIILIVPFYFFPLFFLFQKVNPLKSYIRNHY